MRWLQVGAAGTGIAVALLAAPGTAAADDATAPAETASDVRPAESPAQSTETDDVDQDAHDADDDVDQDDAVEDVVVDENLDEAPEPDITMPPTAEGDETPADESATEEIPIDEGPGEVSGVPAAAVDDRSTRRADQPGGDDVAEVAADGLVEQARVDDARVEDVGAAENVADAAPPSTRQIAAATANVATPVTAAEPPCGCAEPANVFTRISIAVDQFLTRTANWLAGLPQGPVVNFFEGALYLVRRTLFPASVGVITRPVKVPLYFTSTSQSSGEKKLGIYLAMGGSATPQLFEFDTGSAGLYAAYASAQPANSPWWGGNTTSQGRAVHVDFDSGLQYQGEAVTTSVSLFSSANSCTALVNTGQLTVGAMDQIGSSTAPEEYWGPDGASSDEPPIEGAFYGDFGMALTYQRDGVTNVITQLTYGWGIKPGFRVHVDPITGEAWMQIGLTRRDLRNRDAMTFAMVPDAEAPAGATVPNSNVDYYALQLIQATINILDSHGKAVVTDADTGILPDSGASTTLHNTQLSPAPSPKRYHDELIDWTDEPTKGKLYTGLTFFLSGTTTAGTAVTFFEFETAESTDGGRVGVQNESGTSDGATKALYYLNAGMSMFYEYDLVYSLGNRRGGGTLGLIPHGIQSA